MNKVKETSTNQLDMGSLTQIKSFDEEIKKLSEILIKLDPITEQLRNKIESLRNDASYYNGMLNSDTSAFQDWFNQSNYKQNLNNIKIMINTAQTLLSDKSVNDNDNCSDSDYDWMEACGEAPDCYYNSSCNQTCSYTPDCSETGQDVYVIGDDGEVDCTYVGESCTETCGECGEAGDLVTPDPISECSLPGCDDAACMEQISCGQLCTEVIDCDQTVCDVCTFGTTTIINECYDAKDNDTDIDIPDNCSFSCYYGSNGENTPDSCNFDCIFGGSTFYPPTDCNFSVVGGCDYYDIDCNYTIVDHIEFPCDQQVSCIQTITCSLPCGLTICDDSAGCSETCEHNAEDCGNCFYSGCEAGDGDCSDCSDCGDCSDCSNGACSHDCDDGTDTCGEPCGDSCGLF